MKVMNKVTWRHMQLNKKRTLVTVLGVIVSVAMIMAVSITAYSFLDVLIRDEMESSGKWHVQYSDVSAENTDKILEANTTKSAMISKDIGYAKLEDSKNKQKPYVYIKSFDKAGLEGMPITLIEGKLPAKEDEILISSHIEENGDVKYEIGDTISYTIGHRYLEDEKGSTELGQEDSFQEDEQGKVLETFKETGEVKTYTVVGIIERPDFEYDFSPGFAVITYLDQKTLAPSDLVNVSVLLKKVTPELYRNLEDMAKVAGIPGEQMVTNNNLLAYSGASYDDVFNQTLFRLELILIIIIMIGSISLIYNAFAISISERSKHLGMLASIGATKKQKRSSVFFESFIVGIISIPVGILAGIAGMDITFFCINPIFKNVLKMNEGLQVVIRPESILLAVIFSVLTIFISAYIPAKKAAKISPIDAIRQTQDIKLKSKAVKTYKLTRIIFGFEGELALKNLKRFKRRYRATVFSLIISIILFLTASAYGYYLKNAFGLTQTEVNFDAAILSLNEEQGDIIQKIRTMSSVTESSVIQDITASLYLGKEESLKHSSKQVKEYYATNEGIAEPEKTEVRMYAMDDKSLSAYAKSIGVESESLQTEGKISGILINQLVTRSGYTFSDMKPYAGEAGDVLSPNVYGEIYEEETGELKSTVTQSIGEITVAAITEEIPMGLSEASDASPALTFVISDSAMEQLKTKLTEVEEKTGAILQYSNYNVFVNSKTPNRLQKDFEKTLGKDEVDRLIIQNAYETKQESNQTFLLLSVFAYGFIALITAICVANIFNTISTSIALRRREFAMLKSVGMTPGSFNKMIAYESVFYGLKALLYGLPISFGVIYLVYTTVSSSFGSSFTLPWGSIAIAVCSVFIVVGSSMRYSSRKIKKENVIDALKTENM